MCNLLERWPVVTCAFFWFGNIKGLSRHFLYAGGTVRANYSLSFLGVLVNTFLSFCCSLEKTILLFFNFFNNRSKNAIFNEHAFK